jgi:hypothetical protein
MWDNLAFDNISLKKRKKNREIRRIWKNQKDKEKEARKKHS